MGVGEDPAKAYSAALQLVYPDPVAGWAALDALADEALAGDVGLARALAQGTRERSLAGDRRLGLAKRLLDAFGADLPVLFQLGFATESLVDRTYVNAAPPRDPYFHDVVRALAIALDGPTSDDSQHAMAASLAVAAMVAGRRYDPLAEHAHRLLMRLQKPLGWQTLHDLGLFLKTRGRYAEATEILLYATEIGGTSRALFWNLGICATGCRRGDLALETWQDRLKLSGLRLGQFGLPESREPAVQVRIAEHPLATRPEGHDQPGREEIVWVERLSPCHGIVRNALVQPIGTDFGDVVLFDGAPLTTRVFGEQEVPVYAHLCTLLEGQARRFELRGAQRVAGQIAALSGALPGKAVLYIPGDHDVGPASGDVEAVVSGALCVPREVDLGDVVDLLDLALVDGGASGPRLWIPELHRANGDEPRAEAELSAWPPPSRSD